MSSVNPHNTTQGHQSCVRPLPHRSVTEHNRAFDSSVVVSQVDFEREQRVSHKIKFHHHRCQEVKLHKKGRGLPMCSKARSICPFHFYFRSSFLFFVFLSLSLLVLNELSHYHAIIIIDNPQNTTVHIWGLPLEQSTRPTRETGSWQTDSFLVSHRAFALSFSVKHDVTLSTLRSLVTSTL